jgi:probable HAF family extracellular repeat protein
MFYLLQSVLNRKLQISLRNAKPTQDRKVRNNSRPFLECLEDRSLLSFYSVTDLGFPGGNSSRAWGINDLGEVVGEAAIPGSIGYHAFLYGGGQMHDLGTFPGGLGSGAYGINNKGQVIGNSYTADSTKHAFLYNARDPSPSLKDLRVCPIRGRRPPTMGYANPTIPQRSDR